MCDIINGNRDFRNNSNFYDYYDVDANVSVSIIVFIRIWREIMIKILLKISLFYYHHYYRFCICRNSFYCSVRLFFPHPSVLYFELLKFDKFIDCRSCLISHFRSISTITDGLGTYRKYRYGGYYHMGETGPRIDSNEK